MVEGSNGAASGGFPRMSRSRGGGRRVTAVVVLALVLVGLGTVGYSTAAGAPAGLPAGWAVGDDGGRVTLVWTATEPVGLGGARVEVLVGERSLAARVSAGGTRVTAVLPAGMSATEAVAEGLQVVAAGQRLDRLPVATEPAQAGGAAAQALLESLRELPTLAADPGVRGDLETVSGDYLLPEVTVDQMPLPVENQAFVVGPRDEGGSRPVVVFLHGRHPTCFRDGATEEEDEANRDVWPCPEGWQTIPSYRGFAEIQELLASRGYVTVSVSANAVGGQDLDVLDGGTAARSQLVREHLAQWVRWSGSAQELAGAPEIVRQVGRVDPGRVLLVGHSRGGEGVNRVALDSTTGTPVPWTVRGVVHIAPTAFGKNPAPGVPTVVILSACDGDLYDLQGQEYVDSARDAAPGTGDPVLRSSVVVQGANHNFYNSEWTPGESVAPSWEDWLSPTDPVCGEAAGNVRLTPAEQRQVAATYVSAAAALFLDGNAEVLPLLDGTPVRAASVGRAGVTVNALGQLRVPFLVPDERTAVAVTEPAVSTVCRTFDTVEASRACRPMDGPPGPHFLPFSWLPSDPSRSAVSVSWTEAGGSVSVSLPEPVSLAGQSALELRVVSRAGVDGTVRFSVRVEDQEQRTVDLGEIVLEGMEQDRSPASLQARTVRLDLWQEAVRSSEVDLSRLTRLELVPGSAKGRIWLLDAWGWRPGVSDAPPLRLPRLDVGTLDVAEGAVPRTVELSVAVTGPAEGTGQAWVGLFDPTQEGDRPGTLVEVPVGVSSVSTGIPINGDSVPGDEAVQMNVWLKAVRGVCVGDYVGAVTVRDDD